MPTTLLASAASAAVCARDETRDGEPLSNSVVTATEFAGVGGVQATPTQGYATGQYGAAMPATPVPGYGGYPAGGVQPQAGYTPGQINPITGQPCNPQRWQAATQ